MKIELIKAVQVWNTLNHLSQINGGRVSSLFTANMAYLRPEIDKWNKLSQAERSAVGNLEIELPLARITKEHLPEVMPVDMYEALNPIAKGTFKNRKTELEKLLEEKKEADKQEAAEEG